jgi:hypothetical protein
VNFSCTDFDEKQNAVMKEALRIGKVTDHRLSLVAPNEDLVYGEWTMPRGVSALLSSHNHINSIPHLTK